MLRTIHLHGHLKKKFGASHRFDVVTAAEALRALNCAFPGDFITALQAGSYRLVRGDKNTGMRLDIDLVTDLKLGTADLHLIPAAVGASAQGKGTTKTILGAVLIGAAIFMAPATAGAGILGGMSAVAPIGMGVTWGNIALMGLGLALSGASTLLAGNNATADEKKDETSFTINGPTNLAGEGSAIPLIYGEVVTGSVTVSFDANIEDIGAYQGQVGSLGSSVQVVKTNEGFDYYNAVVAG